MRILASCVVMMTVALAVAGCAKKSMNDRMKAAIDSGDLQEVQKCLAEGFDVNANLGGAVLPLNHAVMREKQAIAAYLIEKGAMVNGGDDMGFTPLLTAASTGNHGLVRLLVSKGADVKAKNKLGENALLLLADCRDKGCIEAAQLLINRGTQLEESSAQGGATPFIRAAASGNLELASILLNLQIDPSVRNAEGKNAMNIVRDVHGAAVQAEFRKLLDMYLIEEILSDDAIGVKRALDAGANPNAKTGIMTKWASDTNLNHIPGRDITVLQFAGERNLQEIATILRAAGARDQDTGTSAQ